MGLGLGASNLGLGGGLSQHGGDSHHNPNETFGGGAVKQPISQAALSNPGSHLSLGLGSLHMNKGEEPLNSANSGNPLDNSSMGQGHLLSTPSSKGEKNRYDDDQ